MEIATKTVIISDKYTTKLSDASIFGSNVNFRLPENLDSKLEEEMQNIYTENKPEDILNITVTPVLAVFDRFVLPVKYVIVYTYKYD